MTDVASYAGDGYAVRLQGLDPFDNDLDFLPWNRVHTHCVFPEGRETERITAKMLDHHPEGTPLHGDKPLARRVEAHFKASGTSTSEVADKVEDLVRTADPWTRTYGAGWYAHEGGNAVSRLARRGVDRTTASQIIADLSPQNTWIGTPNHPELGNREEAVRYGRETADMRQGVGKYDDHILTVTDDHAQRARDLHGSSSLLLPGRYDISHEDPKQWDIGPKEMAELPQFHSRAGRRERANGIAAGLGIRQTNELGPKTGPFRHNIEHPYESPYVTTDVHVVRAISDMPKANQSEFLRGVAGFPGDHKRIGMYHGYGYVGVASAVTEATRRLNHKPEDWQRGNPDLLPMHTQAIIWNEHLSRTSGRYRRNMEPLREMPWSDVWGYNFGAKSEY